MKAQRPTCPACVAAEPLPILYGLPGRQMFQGWKRGEILLGGCVTSDDQPEWECARCHHRFRSAEQPKQRSS